MGETLEPTPWVPPTGRAAEIMAAAAGVFSERGFEGASVAEIARRAGISEGAIYKHFESKRHLLLEVIRSFYEPGIAEVQRDLAGVDGTRNKLRFIIWRQLRVYADQPGLCRLVIREIRAGDGYYDSEFHALSRRYTQIAVDVVREAIARGEMREGVSPSMVRDVVFGSVEHLAWALMTTERADGVDLERRADELTALLMGGLAPARPVATDTQDTAARMERAVARLEALADAMEKKMEGSHGHD